MARIRVAVSPFYGGEAWTDELTGIKFEKNPRGLNVYSIPNKANLTNIRKAIRLNSLILVEGNVGDFNEVDEVIVPEKEVVVEEPKEEVVEEEIIVELKEEAEEAPVKAPAKRTTKSTKGSKK
jgi:hypothetical protein